MYFDTYDELRTLISERRRLKRVIKAANEAGETMIGFRNWIPEALRETEARIAEIERESFA